MRISRQSVDQPLLQKSPASPARKRHDAHDFAGHLLNRGAVTEQEAAGRSPAIPERCQVNFTLSWREFPVHREKVRVMSPA